MSYVAPMTSMYAAAPQMTSMYAAAPASMYAAAPSIMAPATTAMPMTTARPSYVAPATTAVAAPSFVAPQMAAPMNLTQGMVPPATLETERVAFEKALAGQLDKQSQAVLQEAKIKQQMLARTAEMQIAQFKLQTEEQLKMQCLQVQREAETTINGLKEAAILQQTSTEERAAVQIAQYNRQKAIEEMSIKSAALQKQWYDGEAKLMAQFNRTAQQGARNGVLTGMMPGVMPGVPGAIF